MEHRAIDAPMQYSAFVSYNHLDRTAATLLQRRIETYRLPRRIARETGTPRLKPVFRDRDELTAAPDLSEAVRAALRQSEHLIVVCTPNSAQSDWVGREIDYFRSVHGDSAILTALCEGSTETSFHKALLKKRGGAPAHPLAADFRKGGDGRLALLKLVAVLAHVGLDELVQRDAQRQLRRFAMLAVAILLAVIGAAALVIAALQARATAEVERARSADAVEFQLTEMRAKLQAAGRLDLLADVNRGIARFYAGRDPATLSIKEQLDRARLLQAKTDDDLQRGHFAAARESASEAGVITSGLLKAHPSDGQAIFADAQSEYWLGLCDWRLEVLAPARAHFERYHTLTRTLVSADPANVDWRLEQGYARSNLAMLMLLGSADAAHARPLFEAAQEDLLAAAAKRPREADLRFEIADGEAWLAASARVARDYPDALRHRTAQLAMLDALIRQSPRDARFQSARIGALIGLGRLALSTGNLSAAQRRFDEARDLAAARLATDPENDAIARHKRAIEIFMVQTWLALPPKQRPELAIVVATLGDCGAEERKADNQELATFCSVESARVRLAAGDRAGAQRALVAAERQRAGEEALSRRWNLDLTAELRELEAELRGTMPKS